MPEGLKLEIIIDGMTKVAIVIQEMDCRGMVRVALTAIVLPALVREGPRPLDDSHPPSNQKGFRWRSACFPKQEICRSHKANDPKHWSDVTSNPVKKRFVISHG